MPELAAFGLALPFPEESWLSAGLDQGHVGVGEAEMVANLVDQHVADDAVYRLIIVAGVAEYGNTVEKDRVGQICGRRYAFERQPHAMIQPEQIIPIQR